MSEKFSIICKKIKEIDFSDIPNEPFGEEEILQVQPVVYFIYNKKYIYVGQTAGFLGRDRKSGRMQKHMRDKVPGYQLTDFLVVYHKCFNKSVIYDLETFLIDYLFGDNKRKLINDKTQRETNYNDKEEIRKDIFLPLWNELYRYGIVNSSTSQKIEESLLFRFSPYKNLGKNQQKVVKEICEGFCTGNDKNIIVSGEPGTGKSLLIAHCVYELVKNRGIQANSIAVVMPQENLAKVFNDLFKAVSLAVEVNTPKKIIKSGKKYSILFIDEAHRLKVYFNKIKLFVSHLNPNKIEDNELVLLQRQAEGMVVFYDSFQTIRPADIDPLTFERNVSAYKRLVLSNQYRIRGKFRNSKPEDYIKAIRIILQMEEGLVNKQVFNDYDFGIVDSMLDLKKWIDGVNSTNNSGRNRLVSGYAFAWESNKKRNRGNKQIYDFKEGMFKARWNKTNVNWIATKGSDKEVGSIHAVQGEDLNRVGVIIGRDIGVDQNGKIILKKENYYDRNGTPANKGDDSRDDELLVYIKNIYYVLLTRACF